MVLRPLLHENGDKKSPDRRCGNDGLRGHNDGICNFSDGIAIDVLIESLEKKKKKIVLILV